MDNKKKLLKVTAIGILLLWGLSHLLSLLFMNVYIYIPIYALIYSSIVLYLFKTYKTFGIKNSYLYIIAFALPIVLYTVNFLGNQVYYLFDTEEKEQILLYTENLKYEGFYANMERFYSPLEYSITDALTNKSTRDIFQFIKYDRYILAIIIFCQYPVFLLMGYLKRTSLAKK
ncbi:MAG: hypothetical protein ACRCVU_11880 [Flavobacterium sp.]